MRKNILVLAGSPRKGGNSDLLAEAFMAGAREAGHEVGIFRTAEKNIDDCKACDACFSQGRACVFDDDFNELAPLLERAEVLVFCTPLYWFSFPASIKAAIDKFYAFIIGDRPLKIEEGLLIACGGDERVSGFDGLVQSYQLILEYQNWRDRGQLIVTGLTSKGEARKTDALDKAAKLGRGI